MNFAKHIKRSKEEETLSAMLENLKELNFGTDEFKKLNNEIDELQYKLHRKRLMEANMKKDRRAEYIYKLVTKHEQEVEQIKDLSLIELRDLLDECELEDRTITEVSLTPSGRTTRITRKTA